MAQRWNGRCSEQRGGTEKRIPRWNQDVKEAIRAKKDAFKALLQNRSSSDLQSLYSEVRKAAAQAVEISKERSWEEFGQGLASNYSSANKIFWQTIGRLLEKSLSTTTSIKNSTRNILRDEKEILSLWREFIEDLLNTARATPTDTAMRLILGKRKSSRRQKWQQPYED